MPKYRFVISETQTYEMCVEADSKEEAFEIAFEGYGSEGEITSTDTELIECEEELQ